MAAKMGVICFLLLVAITVVPARSVGQGEWITKYRVEDLKTKQVVLERDFESNTFSKYSPVFAGGEYNITITVKVTIAVPYATVKLETYVDRPTLLDRFWELKSSPPPTIVSYNPSERYVELKQEKGSLIISIYGKIPSKETQQTLDGLEVLHKTAGFMAVDLKGPDGELLDKLVLDVIDAKIFEYQNLLGQKEGVLDTLQKSEPKVAPRYLELFEGIVARAEAEAEQGFVDKAISLLNLLKTDEVPREQVPTWMETFFIPVTIGLAVVAAAFAAFSLRVKGRLSYVLLVVEDQIRDLEGITFRASRVDKEISSSLESIKSKLKDIVGA